MLHQKSWSTTHHFLCSIEENLVHSPSLQKHPAKAQCESKACHPGGKLSAKWNKGKSALISGKNNFQHFNSISFLRLKKKLPFPSSISTEKNQFFASIKAKGIATKRSKTPFWGKYFKRSFEHFLSLLFGLFYSFGPFLWPFSGVSFCMPPKCWIMWDFWGNSIKLPWERAEYRKIYW